MSNVIDIRTRKPYEEPPNVAQSVQQFLDIVKAKCAESGVVSLAVMTVTYDDHVDWDWASSSEQHTSFMNMALPDLAAEMKEAVFLDPQSAEEDTDEG